MKIAVVGLGNVGSALLMNLPGIPGAHRIDQIFVIGRSPVTSNGAILDAASAFPEFAMRYVVTRIEEIERADLIVFCAGGLKGKEESRIEHAKANANVLREYLSGIRLKREAILVIVPSPVDDLTEFAHALSGLERPRVVGFGGDLDLRRLQFRLLQRRLSIDFASIVGEHGAKTIPVFPGEDDYDQVANEVRNFLSNTYNQHGRPRNLSSGVLLAALVNTIVMNEMTCHFVCGYHPDYEMFITWPFLVDGSGLHDPLPVKLGAKSTADLIHLIEARKS